MALGKSEEVGSYRAIPQTRLRSTLPGPPTYFVRCFPRSADHIIAGLMGHLDSRVPKCHLVPLG
jgi:hypothetical protein